MNVAVHLAFISWGLLALALFAFRPPRQAVVAGWMIGFLFLPNAGYDLPGLHTKIDIISSVMLLCTLIFHAKRWLLLRLRLFDLPMLVWCLCPFASAVANSMTLYDSLSAVFAHVLEWGIPYFIGRLYFTDLEALRDLAIGVLVGGILYVPLCLWEIRMSPQLHRILYGFHSHEFIQTIRFGGFRPTVFMQHGLAVGMWMCAASLLGFWLWRSETRRFLWRIPVAWFVLVLFLTTVLCKSVNGVVLLIIGCLVYFITKNLRTGIAIFFLVALPPLYMILRTSGSWSGEALVDLTQQIIGPERAESLKVRMDNETILLDKALERKALGWSRWGRSRVRDQLGRDISVTDEIWVIAFGENGLVGLIAFAMLSLMPVVVLLRRCPAYFWSQRKIAPAAALAVLLCLHMIDSLFNALISPIFTLAAGGLIGLRREAIALALKPRLFAPQQTGLRPTVGAPITSARSLRW